MPEEVSEVEKGGNEEVGDARVDGVVHAIVDVSVGGDEALVADYVICKVILCKMNGSNENEGSRSRTMTSIARKFPVLYKSADDRVRGVTGRRVTSGHFTSQASQGSAEGSDVIRTHHVNKSKRT